MQFRLPASVFAFTLVLASASGDRLVAQEYHVLTRPKLPSRDSLDKLNLRLAWSTQLNLDGERDSIASFQIIPGPPQTQIVVQSRRGEVHLFDAETGDLRWKTQVALPYWPGYDAGYNSHSIYVSRRDMLFCLSRDRGIHRFVEINPVTKQRTPGFRVDFAPSTGPAADEERVFLVMNNRVIAFQVPNFEIIARTKFIRSENTLYQDEASTLMPGRLWTYYEPGMQVNHTPVVTSGQLGMVTTDGRFLSFNKQERILRIEYKTYGAISANVSFYGETAYFGSHDYTLYALNARNGQLAWRYLTGAPIVQRPYVTSQDVFIAAEGKGMSRLDRITGEKLWTNNEAQRVLTLNNSFVYALDRLGNMLVLDGLRGTALARYDMREWLVPLSNELTDRIYFTNHDGQLICLRHRDNEDPLVLRAPEPEKRPLTPAPAPAPAMP
jgi:outer membrane protein assembly factor BamB